jgi:hypothetical protein
MTIEIFLDDNFSGKSLVCIDFNSALVGDL